MRADAKTFLRSLTRTHGIHIDPVFLKNSYGDKWKKKAENRIQTSETVIVYDVDACAESEHALWEIKQAEKLGKRIIALSADEIKNRDVATLQSIYDFSSEFDCCFENQSSDPSQLFELYKIMVTSSEQLIQRRQIANGFFITVIGAIAGASSLLLNGNVLTDRAILLLIFPLVIGLLMCRSWSNLIENYGKLNKGKFHVIHRIERSLDAQVFAAEWIALGKGCRKEKYESFTSTEQNVPMLFSCLLLVALVVIFFAADWQFILDHIKTIWETVKL